MYGYKRCASLEMSSGVIQLPLYFSRLIDDDGVPRVGENGENGAPPEHSLRLFIAEIDANWKETVSGESSFCVNR